MKDKTPSVLDKDAERKVFNQVTAATSRSTADDPGIMFRQLSATKESYKDSPAGVPDREPPKDPLWLRIIQVPLTIAAMISLGVAVVNAVMAQFHLMSWLVLVLTGGPLALISYLKWRKEQQAWISRMGWDQK